MKSALAWKVVLAAAGLIGSPRVWAQDVPAAVDTAKAATPDTDPEPGGSQVRIVRLSQVRGSVQMDRDTGRGYEAAFANIPVVAGAKLRTGEGVAEVEFEDNSGLRLAPGTEVQFSRLRRSPSGATETTITLVKGLAYVSVQKTKDAGEFVLQDGGARVLLNPGAHARLDATKPEAELAVFEGSVGVEMGSATLTLAKRETITLNPALQTMSAVQKGTEQVDWDEWDKSQTSYHKGVAGLASAGGFGLYGANDLNYYGSFVDMPGCGTMWRPYFANAAWDPFSNGVWAWYPSAGYSWVSPYPWGWLPFHSGAWAMCGGAGWGWRPGGSWTGLNNGFMFRKMNHPMPHPMPPSPVKNGPTLVPVNTRPLTVSRLTEKGFSFQQNSAGLGVPREAFGKLGGVNAHVNQNGFATRSAVSNGYVEPATGRSPGGMAAGTARSMGGQIGSGRSSAPVSGSAGRGYSTAGGMSAGGMRSGGSAGAGSASAASASSGGGAHH